MITNDPLEEFADIVPESLSRETKGVHIYAAYRPWEKGRKNSEILQWD